MDDGSSIVHDFDDDGLEGAGGWRMDDPCWMMVDGGWRVEGCCW